MEIPFGQFNRKIRWFGLNLSTYDGGIRGTILVWKFCGIKDWLYDVFLHLENTLASQLIH